jgi:hypothetical protein
MKSQAADTFRTTTAARKAVIRTGGAKRTDRQRLVAQRTASVTK